MSAPLAIRPPRNHSAARLDLSHDPGSGGPASATHPNGPDFDLAPHQPTFGAAPVPSVAIADMVIINLLSFRYRFSHFLPRHAEEADP